MPKKTPGKLLSPPPAGEFDKLPIAKLCSRAAGVFYRLHSTDPATGKPWPAVYFSQRDRSRFDPAKGPGTLYIAKSLAGALMEIFDDHWGAVGSPNRTLTRSERETWWVTFVALPETMVFDTGGAALSKIGTDGQLLTGDHAIAREWALRLSGHSYGMGGIAYASRHDYTSRNLAIFRRSHLLPEVFDAALLPGAESSWHRARAHGAGIVYGPAVALGSHPELMNALVDLEVGLSP